MVSRKKLKKATENKSSFLWLQEDLLVAEMEMINAFQNGHSSIELLIPEELRKPLCKLLRKKKYAYRWSKQSGKTGIRIIWDNNESRGKLISETLNLENIQKQRRANPLIYTISSNQYLKARDFMTSFPKEQTAIGGAFTYSFTPTSIGKMVEISHASGKKLDITTKV